MNLKSFESKISEDWLEKLQPFLESKECDEIYKHLKERARAVKIFPASIDTWKAFNECRYGNTRVVFLGLSPYADMTNGKNQADGLCFSNSLTRKEQPSLKLILDAIQDDLGEEIERETDLSYMAHSGVLMLNAALTAEYKNPTSHTALWEPFITWLFKEVLTKIPNLIVVVFGKMAEKYIKYVNKTNQYGIILEHPAYSARQERVFIHKNVFTKINDILLSHDMEPVKWAFTVKETQEVPF